MNKLKSLKTLKIAIALLHVIAWALAFFALGYAIYIGEAWYLTGWAAFYMIRIGFTDNECPFIFWGDKVDNKIKELE